MEETEPGRTADGFAVGVHEACGEDRGCRPFDDDRDGPDAEEDPAQVSEADGARRGRAHEPAAQAEPPGEEQAEQGGERHDAEPADLKEEHDDGLAERGPERRGVDDDEPGHADGGRRGEERLEHRRATACARYGQEQQERADGDGGSEAPDEHLAGSTPDPGVGSDTGASAPAQAAPGPSSGELVERAHTAPPRVSSCIVLAAPSGSPAAGRWARTSVTVLVAEDAGLSWGARQRILTEP